MPLKVKIEEHAKAPKKRDCSHDHLRKIRVG
jgi:hypothetical protein